MQKLLKNLTFWIFLAAVFGYFSAALLGDKAWVANTHAPIFYQLVLFAKSAFLNALKMMIAPIIFFSLLGGIIGIGQITKLRDMGLVTVTYYMSTTCIAIIIGLLAVFFVHPWENSGEGINVITVQENSATYKKPEKLIEQADTSVIAIVKGIFDKALVNPFQALSESNILGIVTCALILGLALLIVHAEDSPLYTIVHDINLVINRVLGWIMKTTPIGIFAIAFDFQLKSGEAIVGQLLSFSLVVFGATMIHGLFVLPTIGWFFGGVKPFEFFKKAAKPLLVAFSTSSSSATLPITIQTTEEEFGVSEGVSGFVFPLGATMNMDGTALFEGIAAVFLAYLYNIDLSPATTFAIFFMAMISSIGAPGMPSASMSGMQMVLLAAGIPLEAIGILIVIDKPLDTFRTAVNVEGDIIGALVTQRFINKKETSS